MRLFICALVVSAAALAGVIGGIETNPVRHRPPAQTQSAAQRVIAKLRPATAQTMQAQAVTTVQSRAQGLTARVGLNLVDSHVISDRMLVMQVEPAAAGESVAQTVARLRADPDVEYAEPDQRRYVHAVPNDTLYGRTDASHPGQWYMQNPASISAPSAINAEAAWDLAQGDAGFVIADIDTGVRYDHPDLQ